MRRLLPMLIVFVLLAVAWRLGYDSPRPPVTVPTSAQALSPSLPLPSLLEIAPTGSVVDVTEYFEAHEAEIASLFLEAHPARLKALFAMYLIHVAKPYGESPTVRTLAEYVTLTRAHCGIYSTVQHEINLALGLESRVRVFEDRAHGWTEVEIDGRYEVFDSTANVWIDQPMEALLRGEARGYRMFYTPSLDMHAPEVFRAHLQEGAYPGYYSIPVFRARLPFIGLEAGVVYFAID